MARKRMFDLDIINQDSFYDLPMEAKALYFLLGMEADDEGFISPKKILRLYGGTEDSLKVLALKGYIIPFKTGVIVITDWKRNNYLDKNKVKPTIYQEEKSQIAYDEVAEKYVSLEKVKPKLNYSLEKVNVEEKRIEENRIEENKKEIIKEKKYFENEEVNNIFVEFLQLRKKLKAVNSDRAINLLVNQLNKYDDDIKIKMIDQSILNSWKSVYELKKQKEEKKSLAERLKEW